MNDVDVITQWNDLMAEISTLEQAPLDVAGLIAGGMGPATRIGDLRAAQRQIQPAYDAAMVERRRLIEAQLVVQHAEEQRVQALGVIATRLAQLEIEEAAALGQFAQRRAALEREQRLITGNVRPGDLPGPQPHDVVSVIVPAGVDEHGASYSTHQEYMTVAEARKRNLAPRHGWPG